MYINKLENVYPVCLKSIANEIYGSLYSNIIGLIESYIVSDGARKFIKKRFPDSKIICILEESVVECGYDKYNGSKISTLTLKKNEIMYSYVVDLNEADDESFINTKIYYDYKNIRQYSNHKVALSKLIDCGFGELNLAQIFDEIDPPRKKKLSKRYGCNMHREYKSFCAYEPYDLYIGFNYESYLDKGEEYSDEGSDDNSHKEELDKREKYASSHEDILPDDDYMYNSDIPDQLLY